MIAGAISRLRCWQLRIPLRVHFAMLTALAVAVLGGANWFHLETRLLAQLENELEERALRTARYLRSPSADLVLQQDVLALHQLLDNVRQDSPDIVYAFVTDSAGQVLAHTFKSDFPASLRFLNRADAKADHQVRTVHIFGEKFRDLAVPLHGGIGVLRLGVRDRRILRQVAGVRRELSHFLLAAALLGAVAAYFLSYFRLRPLARIVAALERFEPGKHVEPIVMRRRDEVADLAAQINQVMARLDAQQRQMRRAEKLVAASKLAAGLAHEINNPLSGLQNCVRQIGSGCQGCAGAREIQEYAAVMLDAIKHIERVIRGLLSFSRATVRERSSVDLRDVVTKGLALTAFRLENNGIEIVAHLPEEPVSIHAAEAQIVEVVVNVVLNAINAMPSGGTLDIALSRKNGHAVLQIADDGCGIPAAHLPRVFEPFFTTKEEGKGTGLGLSVTHGIVTDHGGRIEIDSIPLRGTTVNIILPLHIEGDRDERDTHVAC